MKYAEGGADITIVDPSAERVRLYKAHFAARGVSGQFVQAPFDHLPFPDERVDVACAVFNEPPVVPWAAALAEAFRVLRPGGKVIMALPAKYRRDLVAGPVPAVAALDAQDAERKGRFTGRELREAFAGYQEVRVTSGTCGGASCPTCGGGCCCR